MRAAMMKVAKSVQMRPVISAVRRLAALGGVDLRPIDNTLDRARSRLFHARKTGLVLDVGANKGQYARKIREQGYTGRIISFEPIPEAFQALKEFSKRDPGWESRQFALGQSIGVSEFHVSQNLVSSSLLEVNSTCTDAAASTRTLRSIKVDVRTLESEINADDVCKPVHLKIDTQGTELNVLRGAGSLLSRIDSIECELSLVPLYEAQDLFYSVCEYIYQQGFCAVWVEPGFRSASQELLQMDACFRRV